VNRTPAADASGVALATNVTATFDEAVVGVSATTFLLREGPTALAATVSYDPLTRTATLDPAADLAAGITYTTSLTGGITDAATPPNALAPVSWSFTTGGAPPAVMTFIAAADSNIQSGSPSNNYGTETTLRVRAPNTAEWRAYVKFTVTGFSGAVAEARVRLYATDGSRDAGRIFAVGSTWTETGLTWNNAPAISGSALDSGGPVSTGAWVEFEVTPAVGGNGTFSFALTSPSTDSVYYSSRQGAHPPELVLRTPGS
jgi:hypothetical protein